MLFGVSFCRRSAKTRRRPQARGRRIKLILALFAAAALTALLFIAPQWLLVLLVMILSCAVIAMVCASPDRFD